MRDPSTTHGIAITHFCMAQWQSVKYSLNNYQKASDSIPHNWVDKSIALVAVNSKIFRFCKLSMEKWNTRLFLKTKQEVMQSQPIQIRRGIFSFAIKFCKALIPLTHELSRADCGYQVPGTERKIGHLLYMDDLKLIIIIIIILIPCRPFRHWVAPAESFRDLHQPGHLLEGLPFFFPHYLPHMPFPFYPWTSSSLHLLKSCFPYLPRLPVSIHPN